MKVRHAVPPSATRSAVTLPRKSTIRGYQRDRLIITIEQPWTVGGQTYPNGSLLAVSVADLTSANPHIELLVTPTERQSIESVGAMAWGSKLSRV